jgi:hypothetical protein
VPALDQFIASLTALRTAVAQRDAQQTRAAHTQARALWSILDPAIAATEGSEQAVFLWRLTPLFGRLWQQQQRPG